MPERTTDDVHAAFDAVIDPVVEAFNDDDPGKVAQLVSAVATAHMVIDQLYERRAGR